MGGMNSGRSGQVGKDTTEDCRSLDVRGLVRNGMLRVAKFYTTQWTQNGTIVASIEICSGRDQLIFDYRHRYGGGEWKSQHYPVNIEWTPCHYGGSRAWFRCPANGCGRRVAILFLGYAGIFSCRHCCQLVYASQRKITESRATQSAGKIRHRLGWMPGILNDNGIKPKGMHWKTYHRLVFEHDRLVTISFNRMQKRMQMIRDNLR